MRSYATWSAWALRSRTPWPSSKRPSARITCGASPRCWIHLGGRALETIRTVYPSHPPEQVLERSPQSGARALGDTSHFHIDLYGSYIPGLCAGLALAMEDLGGPLPPGKYPLLDRLAADGIRGFLLQQEDPRFRELAPEAFYFG